MWFGSWLQRRTSNSATWRKTRCRPAAPCFQPQLERLEDRVVPSQINLTVSSLADTAPGTPPAPGTLRAAILAADAGSPSDKFTIGFSVAGTINLESPLPGLNNNIAIQGPGASSLTVERAADASLASAIVAVDPGQTASLSGLTIANGNAGGIFNNNATLTVSGCTISGNSATIPGYPGPGDGGGILNFGALTVSGCTISGNSALGGGGIANAGTLAVSNSTISDNTAGSGNIAGFGGGIDNLNTMTVSGCTVSGNSATGLGGGIYTEGPATVTGSTLFYNTAARGAGSTTSSSRC